MSTLFFSISNQLTIKISSDRDLSFSHNEYLLLKGYIPSIVLLESEPNKVDLIIEHTESENKKLIQDENHIQIFDIWKGVFSADLYHLLYGIVRVQFLKKSLFSTHGACVGKDDYVLIVGHSGAGKTSVVLKLLQDKDIKIFSGNKTVVSFNTENKLVAVAGTPTITIRGSDRNKLDDLKISDHVEYWERYAFMLNPERYEDKASVRIKAIVVVKLNDYVQEHKKINSLSALHNLYPFFLDVVNADVVISDADDVFIGTPPEGTGKYLASHLKAVLNDVPVYSLIGSSDFIADKILKL
jgi:hypothetical protein